MSLQPADDVVEPQVSPERPDEVTCPKCGRRQAVDLRSREASDFCQGENCDFPLFWVPQEILRGSDETTDESLRRRPGTVGRVTVASLSCPHCSELNALDAVVCVRCGRALAVQPQPVVEPVAYVPPPEPAPVLPGESAPLWPLFVLLAGFLVMATLSVLYLTKTWH